MFDISCQERGRTHTKSGAESIRLERAVLRCMLCLTITVSPSSSTSWIASPNESPDVIVALIRRDDQVHSLQLVRKGGARPVQNEMTLHAKTSASEHVATLYHHGSSSAQAYFGITEHCETNLRSRIVAGEGVRDDDFWRWSTQLARGVVDIHGSGVIHLAIKPETVRLTNDTGDVRISSFQNACEATRARPCQLQQTEETAATAMLAFFVFDNVVHLVRAARRAVRAPDC